MIAKYSYAFFLFIALCITWRFLTGNATGFILAAGIASSLATVCLALRMGIVDAEGHPFHLLFHAPRYWMWLFGEMVKSGLAVTRAVWSPTLCITPHFAWISISQESDLGRTIYANSVTLTPGTVCVNVEKMRLFVHALEKSSVEELEKGDIDCRVSQLAETVKPKSC